MDDLVGSPCPFCGGGRSSVMRHEDGLYRVTCEQCGASGPPDVGNRLSVAGWNKRPAIEALRTQIEVLTTERDRLARDIAFERRDFRGAPVVKGCQWEFQSPDCRLLWRRKWLLAKVWWDDGQHLAAAYPVTGGRIDCGKHKTALDAMEAIAAVLGQVTHE